MNYDRCFLFWSHPVIKWPPAQLHVPAEILSVEALPHQNPDSLELDLGIRGAASWPPSRELSEKAPYLHSAAVHGAAQVPVRGAAIYEQLLLDKYINQRLNNDALQHGGSTN